MDIDIAREPLGAGRATATTSSSRDIWPDEHEVARTVESAIQSDMFRRSYAEVFSGDERWRALASAGQPNGAASAGAGRFAWDPQSTYVRQPPVLRRRCPPSRAPVRGRRARARARAARRQRHDRSHLARGVDQARQPGRARTCSSTASRCATSTPTARAAATTR